MLVRTRSDRLSLAASLLIAPLLLASCSSGTTSEASTASAQPADSAPASAAAEGGGGGASVTLADVAAHSTSADCWTAIGDGVYDVTDWITAHPGGSAVIEALCGKDGTAAYTGQHEGEGEPDEELAELQVGVLAG